MSRSIVLKWMSLVMAIICLGLAYLLAGYWWIFLVLPGMAATWFYLKRKSSFWADASILFIYVILSAAGITARLFLPLLVLGCTASLAYWDLENFQQSLPGLRSNLQTHPLEGNHLHSLGMAIGTGLVFTSIGSMASLHLSFGVTAILVVIAVGGLIYGMQSWIKLQG